MNGDATVNSRNRKLVIVFVAIAVLVGVLAVKRAVNGNADLSGNYRLWRINLTEATLPVRREGPDPQDPDSYPPLSYALYAPFGALPLWAAATAWYVLNVGCSVYLWREARRWLRTECETIPQASFDLWGRKVPVGPDLLLALAVVAVLPFWMGSLLLGQNTLLVMSLTWGAFQSVQRSHPWLAGWLLAVATTTKVLPVVFATPFLITRNSRVILACVVAGLMLLLGLGSLYFGPRTNYDFHLRWLQFATHGPENRPPDPHDPNTLRGSLRYHNQSIETVLARVLMAVPIHNKPGAELVNLANVSAATWRRTRSVGAGLCIILAIVVLVHNLPGPASSATPTSGGLEPTSVETYSILSLLQLFISPVVWSHYYTWLFWPLLLTLVSAVRGRRSGYLIYTAWLATLPFLAVPVARAVGIHLWLTLAIYVWICWPQLRLPARTGHENQAGQGVPDNFRPRS